MRKVIVPILLVLLLCFCACSERGVRYADLESYLESEIDTLEWQRYALNVAEDEEFVYCAKVDGIYRFDKSQNTEVKLIECESPHSLYLHDGHIYYTDSARRDLHRAALAGGKSETVIYGEDYSYRAGSVCIMDYFIEGTSVYIHNAAMAVVCELGSRECRELVGENKGSLTWLEPNSLSSMNFCVFPRALTRNIRILLRRISQKSIKNSFDDRCEAVLREQIFVPKRQRPQVIYEYYQGL